MKPILRGDKVATLRSRRVDLAGQYGYSDAAKAAEPVSGDDIRRAVDDMRRAYPVRFDESFLRDRRR
jgi:hypothetical protein